VELTTSGIAALRSKRKLITSVDDRMIGVMRLILASSALLIISIDPSEPDRLVNVTYASLVLYVVFSATLYFLSLLKPGRFAWLSSWAPWMDVGWYIILVALSSGTNSIFFFFFFFPILVSSFRQGFKSGLQITIASAVLFIIVGYATAPSEPHFQLNRFLLRPVYLMVLGYMIAYWGGYEIRLKQRLQLLRDISTFSNPRFGIDHTVNWMMERLREFFESDSVLLILETKNADGFLLRRVTRENANSNPAAQAVAKDIATLFLSTPADEALINRGSSSGILSYNLTRNEVARDENRRAPLASALEYSPFMSVPVNHHGRLIGRCYFVGGPSKYSSSDVNFILQAIDQVLPVIDNIRLVDRMASDAAEHERERIARDIHDSVIQPYIGFQLGLTAVMQKIQRGDADVPERINELSDLTAKGISDLRHYIRGIKSEGGEGGILLTPAVRRFASKFSQATGIQVEVQASDAIALTDRLAGEVFQMINEGLSNVRRHTRAQKARAVIIQENGNLLVRIENEVSQDTPRVSFRPRSLSERAAALGGQLTVEDEDGRSTIVNIRIPL
jgi:signal transduction histidine kinase